MKESTRYTIISPTKNESEYIEFTLRSIVEQSLLPVRWVIVDDGSSDGTPEIVDKYLRKYPWIELIRLPHSAERDPGPAGVRAFTIGLQAVQNLDYDYIVKLDTDLELPRDYFEAMLERFEIDPCLGIASGQYVQYWRKTWRPAIMPDYHAAGCSKVIRKKCLTDFGGYVPILGWDTIDEIRAQIKGWKTQHFQDLRFKHLRVEGSSVGFNSTFRDNGATFYLLGGTLPHFLLKLVRLLLSLQPLSPVWAGAMLWGYLSCALRRVPRLATSEEAVFYQGLLHSRIEGSIRTGFSLIMRRVQRAAAHKA